MRAPGWIQTRSGSPFWPLDPLLRDVRIEDIAHALSHVCRFTGHVSRFYSVAEHLVRVGRRVHALTGDKRLALHGLLHDASEAYLADIAAPIKRLPEFAGYRAAERNLQRVICQRFGLDLDEPEVVKRADLELLGAEAEGLVGVDDEWRAAAPPGVFPVPFELLGISDLLGWEPEHAAHSFRAHFEAWS